MFEESQRGHLRFWLFPELEEVLLVLLPILESVLLVVVVGSGGGGGGGAAVAVVVVTVAVVVVVQGGKGEVVPSKMLPVMEIFLSPLIKPAAPRSS